MKKESHAQPSQEPFSFSEVEQEPPPFWNVEYSLREAGVDLARVLFDPSAPSLTKIEIQARVDNYYWRLAYPGERLRYAQALQRARGGDDETLFKLVRLFGEYVERFPWFAQRLTKARQEYDQGFALRYNEARRAKLPLPNRGDARLFILAFFEPELCQLKPKAVMRALQGVVDAGKAPREVLPLSLSALRVYLHDRFGWRKKR